jgi:uncharacterized protein
LRSESQPGLSQNKAQNRYGILRFAPDAGPLSCPQVFGTFLNVAGILLGGLVGLTGRRTLTRASETYVRNALAAFTIFFGLRFAWLSLGSSVLQVFKQLLLVVVAMSLGKLLGKLFRLQKLSNSLGQGARQRIAAANPAAPNAAGEGFKTCAALFCAAPLGILGAVQDGFTSAPGGIGTSEYFYPLAVKAVVDGLAAMGFVGLFGWGVLLSVVPVLALQGAVSLFCARLLGPTLGAHGLVNPVNATGGFLVASVALVMLGIKRIELADYLPSLAVCPLLAWWLGW